MKKILTIFGRLITWILFIFIWLVYAYSTLDRSSGQPLPGGYSFVVLPVLVTLLMRRGIFNKRMSGYNLFSKIIVFLLFIIGLLIHFIK